MKSTILLLATIVLLFTSNIVNAQITTTGMTIQGIARDASNNAITNATIGLEFTVHYTKAGSDVALAPTTASLTTDAFGVFSYVLDMSSIENTLFYDYQLKLKIRQTNPDALISDEDLRFVPYAVSASNGVPTGSIMPFAGSVAPRGWVLCNGAPLPSSAVTLKAMIGDNAPDLRAMFLRGTGTNATTGYTTRVGPNLGAIQADVLKSHLHEKGTIATSSAGDHTHTTTFYNDDFDGSGGSADQQWGLENDSNINGNRKPQPPTSSNGAHTHTISGSTALTGDLLETRPVNYGVNYIIKL
jgi:microcystin-dependent protein